ncbi:MAG: addiction module protein [Myxococcales bacterium]|nr:addiction module protein [Myxococcales bacterium]
MTSTAKRILDEALSLPDDEREALVEVLITSLQLDSPEDVERAWSEEIVRRLERHERGETVALDWEEAKRRIRIRHGFE